MPTITPLLVDSLDHIVLTVRDVQRTIEFYESALGLESRMFKPGRYSLHFGGQKINLHLAGANVDPYVRHATPGSADLCFRTSQPIEGIIDHLKGKGIEVILGPVNATGARKMLRSIYIYDPDENLVEIANEV